MIIAFALGSLIWGGLLIGLWGRTPGKAALKLKVVWPTITDSSSAS